MHAGHRARRAGDHILERPPLLTPAAALPAGQALAAGLVDEVVLHVASVLLGCGVRPFAASQTELRCIETIRGEGAVHLRYEVR